MNTKKAIHKIRYWLTFYVEGIHEEAIVEAIKQIEEASIRGEKFEEMWEELSDLYGNYFSTFDVGKANDVEYKYLDELMIKVKQKYFPPIEILSKAKIDIDKVCKELADFHEKLLKKYFPLEEEDEY